jgi:zinc protease
MTILVREAHTVPKVSIQLWYNVGSKDEGIGERGIAHLIEHMVFKGTQKLSESDINMITHMLSGSCNAFTSYDYTGYLFNFPKQHWQEALVMMSDCMRGCSFKEDMLSSEMKAVIQELKMYRDNYTSSLFEKMVSTIFDAHPYHHPIIGYKEDLWNASSQLLKNFYNKHYVPNNAALVVVGDVAAQEVFEAAERYFGAIPYGPNYKKATHLYNQDIIS